MSIQISDGSVYKLMEREGSWELFAEYHRTVGNTKPINYIVQNKAEKITKSFKTLSSAMHTFNKLKYA